MGKPQSDFLNLFKHTLENRLGNSLDWLSGQQRSNTAPLPKVDYLRRPGHDEAAERFELGDLRADIGQWRVVIEFESREVPLSNLLKYWPYIRGELKNCTPDRPLLICHFSDWWSYGTRRDLWQWTLEKMKADRDSRVEVDGRQFDHWGNDDERRRCSIDEAINWILGKTNHPRS